MLPNTGLCEAIKRHFSPLQNSVIGSSHGFTVNMWCLHSFLGS
uniref:Uncharacterized protein n=1 Tax=Anguilla anguilla TaxID=7936 RepID=A0A0E9WQI5_ANGAN